MPYGAWIETQDAGGLKFYLARNLSIGGVLLQSEHSPPPLGHRVRLRLIVENEARVMSVHGEVVRHEDDGETFAIRFTELDPVRKAFLDDLIGEMDAPSA